MGRAKSFMRSPRVDQASMEGVFIGISGLIGAGKVRFHFAMTIFDSGFACAIGREPCHDSVVLFNAIVVDVG